MTRFVTPVGKNVRTGLAGQVYAQVKAEFGFVGELFAALSPAPEVLAATWALLRESLLAGPSRRTDKEVIALGVSVANRCPFCVDAHTVFLHAMGEHALGEAIARGERPAGPRHTLLLDWARRERATDLPVDQVGTALACHFVNRMVSALVGENLLPGGMDSSPFVRRAAGRAMSRNVRRRRVPGLSLTLIPRGCAPSWAEGSSVGPAYAALRAAATGEALSRTARQVVRAAVGEHDAGHPPPGNGWLEGPLAALPERERPATRLALLAALAPYRITEREVAAWPVTDAELVRLLAFGAFAAVEHVERAITPSRPGTAPAPSSATASP
ncbi:carboxymuconolactone decarboxylase family protein [Nonomuraea dietziae]|uniref:carboxymuconolactone decarboxylase family protein n=1 Tax=Nonomuraea dietziae TaxID=65515 RepID=UPI00342F46C9